LAGIFQKKALLPLHLFFQVILRAELTVYCKSGGVGCSEMQVLW